MSRLQGAFGLLSVNGQSATQGSNRPPSLRNSTKNGNCPSGVAAALGSHSTCTRPPKVSAHRPTASGRYSTDDCSPAGCAGRASTGFDIPHAINQVAQLGKGPTAG